MDELVKTPYLEIERDSPQLIAQQRAVLESCSLLENFSDFPTGIMVMNRRRQILFCNDAVFAMLKLTEKSSVYGMRIGESLACINYTSGSGDCGVGPHCPYCGAAQALAKALSDENALAECMIEQKDGDHHKQLDLKIWTKPLKYADEEYIMVGIIDISAEKRREALERIFLHDVMNTAGSLSSLLRLLDPQESDFLEYLELAQSASDQLTDEILSHRVLNDAELGILSANIEKHSLAEICAPVIATYKSIAETRSIGFYADSIPDIEIQTDSVLLNRVLANLLKNAIEASRRQERVSLFFTSQADLLKISIHNPALMDAEVKANLFRCSFSTKGRGRGLGSYSARLFVEDYLHGTLSYTSEEGSGTTFYITLKLVGQTAA